jgi:hypothetical protein
MHHCGDYIGKKAHALGLYEGEEKKERKSERKRKKEERKLGA